LEGGKGSKRWGEQALPPPHRKRGDHAEAFYVKLLVLFKNGSAIPALRDRLFFIHSRFHWDQHASSVNWEATCVN